MKTIAHIPGGTVEFNESEIAIRPSLFVRPPKIPWSDIEFLSITPAVKKIDQRWVTFQDKEFREDDLIGNLGLLNIDVVIKDRHAISRGCDWFTKLWIRTQIKALYGSDDHPERYRGFLNLEVRVHTLDSPLESFLDFLSSKAKFDLLCHDI